MSVLLIDTAMRPAILYADPFHPESVAPMDENHLYSRFCHLIRESATRRCCPPHCPAASAHAALHRRKLPTSPRSEFSPPRSFRPSHPKLQQQSSTCRFLSAHVSTCSPSDSPPAIPIAAHIHNPSHSAPDIPPSPSYASSAPASKLQSSA